MMRKCLSPAAALRFAVVLLLSVGGCFTKAPEDWGSLFDKAGEQKPAAGTTKFDVVGQNLGEGHEVSLPADALVRRVAELLKAEQPGHAAAWIERHPETTLEVLASLDPAIPPNCYSLMAHVYDARTASNRRGGWTQVAELRVAQATPLAAYAEARKLFQSRMTEGHVDRALELELAKKAADCGVPVLLLDAMRIEGTAYLLGDRPREAAAVFARGAAQAVEENRYQAAYLMLLESDARRRSGDVDGAVDTWYRAVTLCSQLVVSAPPILDPVLWEKLSYLRPADSAWPSEIVVLLLARDPLPGVDPAATLPNGQPNPATAESVVWHAVGRWYLERGQAQAALLAFKRSESVEQSEEARQWLRLRQARALAQLDQSGPATAILVALISDKRSSVSRPASALLGSIYFQRAQTQKSLALLKRAVEQEDGVEWPERSEAEADLALAYLSVGDAVAGLDRLHLAQRRFEADDDREHLAIALENEIRFLEHAGRRREVGAVRERLLKLERSWQ